ncbi:hypothetical protein [Pantoea agglomerans]|uniref:phage tail fiber protein n=1 Tax=Enterobacter agglomerans TaxID=549 RepID=UPI002413670E|nr:hypothetical protein [Pantoea agglomerans]
MAWYRTGTIAATKDGKTITGTGTKWADNKQGIGAGQMLLVPGSGSVEIYEIATVKSDTELTLTDAVTSNITGSAYAILAFYGNSYPDFARQLAAQLKYYQSQMDGWQEIMTGTGDVTLVAPDGTQVTISSMSELTSSVKGKLDASKNLEDLTDKTTARKNLGFVDEVLPVSLGGTGGNTPSAARSGLGLKSGATTDVVGSTDTGNGAGKIPLLGSTYGSGNNQRAFTFASNNTPAFSGATDATWTTPLVVSNGGNISASAAMIFIRDGSFANYFGIDQDNQWAHGGWSSGANRYRFWSERITTVDGNGFIKRASPIVRVAETGETMPDNFGEGNFIVGDFCAVNDEAEGVTVTKTDAGIYEISGTNGLYPEGWTIEIPQDENGNRLCFASVAYENKKLLLKINKRKFDVETAMTIAGDPMNIPAGRWVDLRVAMPEDSLFNKKAAAAKDSLAKILADELKAQVETGS